MGMELGLLLRVSVYEGKSMKKRNYNIDFIYGILLLIFIPDNVISSYNEKGFSIETFWYASLVLFGAYLIYSFMLYNLRR